MREADAGRARVRPAAAGRDGRLAFKAVGKVEAAEQVLTPGIDMATAGGGKVRLVYELGAEYDEYSVGATWEDMKLWTPHLRSWERCAVVTNHRMLGDAVRAFAMLSRVT